HFGHMRRDAARYLPALAEAEYVDSLWEVKTVLPVNESDDGRPILFQAHAGLPNFHCVLGAKIDNIFDVLDQIDLQTAPGAKVAWWPRPAVSSPGSPPSPTPRTTSGRSWPIAWPCFGPTSATPN